MRTVLVLVFLTASSVLSAFTQQCSVPVLTNSAKSNMFSPALEYDLGEIAAQRDVTLRRLIEIPEITDRLNHIGERLARQLPPNEIEFRFFIVDEGSANAWAFPGGRIYVTRKLISFTKSEDELAAVIAHEMGHQLVHHGAIDFTRVLRSALDLETLKTRADVEAAYNKPRRLED